MQGRRSSVRKLPAYFERTAWWMLNENSGLVARDTSGYQADGVVSGVTWEVSEDLDNDFIAKFDGVNDLVNVYSAVLASKFSGLEGTVTFVARVSAAGVWTDGAGHILLLLGTASAANKIYIYKATTNNTLQFVHLGGVTTRTVTYTPVSEVGWMRMAMTWSVSADEMKAYVNGVQVGATQTGLGVWTGDLNSSQCILGALTLGGAGPWSGWLGRVRLWSKALSASEIAKVSR